MQVNSVPPRSQGISEEAFDPSGGPTGSDGSFGTITLKGGSTVLGSAKVLCNQALSIPATESGTTAYAGCWATIQAVVSVAGMDTLTADYSGNAGNFPSTVSVTNDYMLLPQIATVTLAGVYPGRGTYAVNLTNTRTGDVSRFPYTPSSSNENSSDIAMVIAALISASPDYVATASGSVITITGHPSIPYSVETALTANGHIFTSLFQEASLPRDAENAVFDVIIEKDTQKDASATFFSISFTQNFGKPNSSTYFSDITLAYDFFTPAQISDTLCQRLYAKDNRFGCTYDMTYGKNVITAPWVPGGWHREGTVSNRNYLMIFGQLKPGRSAILAPQAQVTSFAVDGGAAGSDTGVYGKPIPGAIYTVVLEGVPYAYTALASDTTNDHIAAALAAMIAGVPQYIVSVHSETPIRNAGISVEYASTNYPFSYSASVTSPVTASAAITRPAR